MPRGRGGEVDALSRPKERDIPASERGDLPRERRRCWSRARCRRDRVIAAVGRLT
jgi:hypothetical protein